MFEIGSQGHLLACVGLAVGLCQVVFRGLRLIRNLTVHDILSVDAILQHSLAPDLMLQLGSIFEYDAQQ